MGDGPYLLGWTLSLPEQKQPRSTFAVAGLVSKDIAAGPIHLHSKKLQKLPLHALVAGTEILHFGVVHAVLRKPGYARVLKQHDNLAYVYAAVDDDVVVEGWVAQAKLGLELDQTTPRMSSK
jgi:hypothetical protein